MAQKPKTTMLRVDTKFRDEFLAEGRLKGLNGVEFSRELVIKKIRKKRGFEFEF